MPCRGRFYFNTNQPIAGLAKQINLTAIALSSLQPFPPLLSARQAGDEY